MKFQFFSSFYFHIKDANFDQKSEIVGFSSLMYRSIPLHVVFQVPLLLTPLYKLIIHCDGYILDLF